MKNIVSIFILSLATLIFLGCEEKTIGESTNTSASADKSETADKYAINKDDNIIEAENKVDNLEDLNIHKAENNSTEEPIVKKVRISQKGWYIRLTAKSDSLVDDKAVFGYLQGASDGRDRYDTQAYASSGLYVVIYNGNFGAKKEYRSDYRAFKASGSATETWVLRVYNRRGVHDDITLSWDGITLVKKRDGNGFDEEQKKNSTELQNMRLIDSDEGLVINASEDQNYSFNMNGKIVKEFKWIMLADGDDEPEP